MLKKIFFLICAIFGVFGGYLGHYVTRLGTSYWETPTPYIGFLFGILVYYSSVKIFERKDDVD